MTLIPGVDPNGDAWKMSFFHAFYFVSFMGTTIGFGEIPYEFTDGQRAWVLTCIYISVIAWLYGIGTVLRLLQDETFISAVSQRAFKQSIKRADTPFYIICGYGETGQFITRGLSRLGIKSVIIDHNVERTHTIEIENLEVAPIVLTADITEPQNLIDAGINHLFCKGVIALTQDDHTNLKIAVACKLVNPKVKVICRSEIEDEAKNMASFGTDNIINPFLTFGRRLSLLTQNPTLHRIHNWFINQHSPEDIDPTITENGLPHGKWIICGYGRFGKAVHELTSSETIESTIVDVDPIKSMAPSGTIVGRGTEAETLNEAGIASAVVVVAASNDDANNLSILITAKQLNPDIITIARVSKESNYQLFISAKCNYIMRRSQVVANEALTIISRPLVTKFLQYSSSLTPDATEQLISRICQHTSDQAPVTWRLALNHQKASAMVKFLENDNVLTIADVSSHSRFPKGDTIPLLLLRGGMSHLLPSSDMVLAIDDELLLCGSRHQTFLAQRLIDNPELIDSLINNNQHHIPLIRWLKRRHSNQ
jgi:Trk K+ transport system NAD-binding subunit